MYVENLKPIYLAGGRKNIFYDAFQNLILPITSAELFEDVNQASSPNFPILYLVRRSFGNPQTTEIKCGCVDLCRAGSRKVENLFFNIRESARTVINEDCIFTGRISFSL